MLFKELTREEDLEISRLDGYEEGERVGAEQEKIGIAKKLKALGLGLDAISESTGLTLEEVAAL